MTLKDLCADLKASKCSLNDQAIVLIEACIASDITGGREIIDTLRRLGFNARHVGIQLTKNAGSDPKRHRWCKEDDGRYRLHN